MIKDPAVSLPNLAGWAKTQFNAADNPATESQTEECLSYPQ